MTVVLPIILPAVLSGAIFAFATSFDELVIAIFITGPGEITLPRQMFAGIREATSPIVAAVSVLTVVLSIMLLLLVEAVRRHGQRVRRAAPGSLEGALA